MTAHHCPTKHGRHIDTGAIPKVPNCRDLDDLKFLQLSAAAEAEWLITGDTDLLDLEREIGFLAPAKAADPYLCVVDRLGGVELSGPWIRVRRKL